MYEFQGSNLSIAKKNEEKNEEKRLPADEMALMTWVHSPDR